MAAAEYQLQAGINVGLLRMVEPNVGPCRDLQEVATRGRVAESLAKAFIAYIVPANPHGYAETAYIRPTCLQTTQHALTRARATLRRADVVLAAARAGAKPHGGGSDA